VYAVVAFVGLRLLRRREDKMLADRLAEYVAAGWLDADETASAADAHGRRAAAERTRRLPTLRRRAAHAFYAAQTLLALNRERALTGSDFGDTEREDARLRNLVASARAVSVD
jgi:hypothetical protein